MEKENSTKNLYISSSDIDLKQAWEKALNLSGENFYKLMTKNLPTENNLYLDINYLGEGFLTLKSKSVEADIYFAKKYKEMNIKEIRVNEEYRRNGIGKSLLRNCLNLSQTLGIETIRLRAGREDGEFFWSRRCALLEDVTIIKDRFIIEVKENLSKIENRIDKKTSNKVNKILSINSIRMNFAIASMKETLDNKPIGIELLKLTNPRLHFNLKDKKQMHDVALSLK